MLFESYFLKDQIQIKLIILKNDQKFVKEIQLTQTKDSSNYNTKNNNRNSSKMFKKITKYHKIYNQLKNYAKKWGNKK